MRPVHGMREIDEAVLRLRTALDNATVGLLLGDRVGAETDLWVARLAAHRILDRLDSAIVEVSNGK